MDARIRRGLVGGALSATLALALTGPANAALVEMDGETLRITASPGEKNMLYVSRDHEGYWIYDDAPMTFGPGCSPAPEYRATYRPSGGCTGTTTRVEVTLGDGDDQLQFGNDAIYPGVHLEADGGAGKDGMANHGGATSRMLGGDDQDHIYGGPGPDVIDVGGGHINNAYGYGGDDHLIAGPGNYAYLYGGDGNDLLVGGEGSDLLYGGDWTNRHAETGRDTLIGNGDGDDLVGGGGADVIKGGAGGDVVDYSAHVVPVHVTLDGEANDGAAGENDEVDADVDGIRGSPHDDTLIGNAETNWIEGGSGRDEVFGRESGDVIDGGMGDDRLAGEAGGDRVQGGTGADEIVGGPDRDTLTGNEHDDRIDARDPGADPAHTDEIACNEGVDVALVDSAESPTDCERVEYPDRPPVTVPEQRNGDGPWENAVSLVSDPETANRSGQAVITNAGETVVAWSSSGGAEGSGTRWGVKRPGQPFERHDLGTAPYSSPSGMVADKAGNVFLAWAENSVGTLKIAMRPPGGEFGTPETIGDLDGAQLLVNDRGDVAAVMFEDKRFWVSIRAAGGWFGAPVPVSETLDTWPHSWRAAFTDAGEVLVAFNDYHDQPQQRVLLASRAPDGTVRPIQQLNSGLRYPGDIDLAVDSQGRAIVTWNESRGLYYEGTANRVWDTNMMSLRRTAAGVFNPPTTVPGAKSGANGAQTELSRDGLLTIAYEWWDQGRVYSAPFGEQLELVKTFDLAQVFTMPELATSPGGELVIGWGADLEAWITAFRTREGEFGRVEDLRPGCEHTNWAFLDINDLGQAAAIIFEQSDNDDWTGEPYVAVTGDRHAAGRQECADEKHVYAEEEAPPEQVPGDNGEQPPFEIGLPIGPGARPDNGPAAQPPAPAAQPPVPAKAEPGPGIQLAKLRLSGKGRKRVVHARLGCERPGTATIKLKLRSGTGRVLARVTKRVSCKLAGKVAITLRLSKQAARRLALDRPARLTASTSARGSDGLMKSASAFAFLD